MLKRLDLTLLRRWMVRPTRVGVRFLLLLLVMGFAAYNTRNNLLYLMFSVGLATVVVSITTGWLSLRRIEIATGEPSDLYARTPSTEHFQIRNHSRWLEGYGLEVEEADFPGGVPRAVLSHLGRGEVTSLAIRKIYPRRGIYKAERIGMKTLFPFGLFRIARRYRLGREVTVFPRIVKVDISYVFQQRFGPVPHRQRGGESEELLRIREYSAGDSFHYVNWKATAKLGKLMVREFASSQQRSFSIVFDNFVHRLGEPEQFEERFEETVSIVASLASHLASHALPFSIVSCDEAFPHGFSQQHLRGVLTHLAVLKLSPRPRVNLVDWAKASLRNGDVVLVVSAYGPGPWQTLISPSLHLLTPEAFMRHRSLDNA